MESIKVEPGLGKKEKPWEQEQGSPTFREIITEVKEEIKKEPQDEVDEKKPDFDDFICVNARVAKRERPHPYLIPEGRESRGRPDRSRYQPGQQHPGDDEAQRRARQHAQAQRDRAQAKRGQEGWERGRKGWERGREGWERGRQQFRQAFGAELGGWRDWPDWEHGPGLHFGWSRRGQNSNTHYNFHFNNCSNVSFHYSSHPNHYRHKGKK